jgi:hypothetical protein
MQDDSVSRMHNLAWSLQKYRLAPQRGLNPGSMRKQRSKISTQTAIALITILLLSPMTRGQDVTEPALKAAFIINIAKFTNWPEDGPASSVPPAPKAFSMCVLGDTAVGEALERSVQDRLLEGSSISVTRLKRSESVRGCRLLYLSGVTKEQSAQILTALKGTPVLTISDLGGFNELGGVVQFFFERGQLRFSVGMESVKKSGLQLSAKLLDLAVRR